MIITYRNLTNNYREIVKNHVDYIGQGVILDREDNILLKFDNIHNVTSEHLESLNTHGEIVFIYPHNIREGKKTLDICVESYLIRRGSIPYIADAIKNSCPSRNINKLCHINLKEEKLIW